jgi:hypothetical protein
MSANRHDARDAGAALERERIALSLLRRAGRRCAPPPEMGERVYKAMLEVWSSEIRRRQQLRWRATAAAGFATVALCVSAWVWQQSVAATDVASVTRLNAAVSVLRGGQTRRIASGFELRSGDQVDLPVGGSLAAQRPDGVSVRAVGPASFVWDAPERIQLVQGRLYVDTGTHPDSTHATFEVRTPMARIEHVGTRFVADASPSRVRVAVRDGDVRLISTNGEALALSRGQAAEAASGGQIARVAPPTRTDWDWVEALASPCGIEGRSLFDVLRQLAREADLDLAFASPDVERRAHGLTLHGPALDLPPRIAINAVLAATDLDADLTGQRVVLRDRMISKT